MQVSVRVVTPNFYGLDYCQPFFFDNEPVTGIASKKSEPGKNAYRVPKTDSISKDIRPMLTLVNKPVLTLVPKVEPAPAALALATLRLGIINRNSRLKSAARGKWDDCYDVPTNAYSGERTPFRLPDDGDINRNKRMGYGGSFRNAGRKPRTHIKFLQKGQKEVF